MKRISTLGFGFLFSLASFAAAPSRLTVTADGNAVIKVTVDGNRFDQASAGNIAIFDNLQPGFHSVKVYGLTDKRFGSFRHGADYRLLYATSVNMKPFFATSIALNRFGNAQLNEQPIKRGYDNTGWNNEGSKVGRGYDNDRGYNNHDEHDNSDKYYGNNHYGRSISDQDFFAAERVMDRENDNGRLLYAKRLVDDNYLCAEQVKELARFFSFDNYRLDFVKYAYGKTTDKGNFSVVCNAFSSNDGRNQVMNFIRSCR